MAKAPVAAPEPEAPKVDDFSFAAALEAFKATGSREADLMQRTPLKYLKAKETHKLRILPGLKNPVAWFSSCARHYLGDPLVAPIKKQGTRKMLICPQTFSSEPCFVCAAKRYLEAVQSNIAGCLNPWEIGLVNAFPANTSDATVAPYVMTKSNMTQLMDQWKDGYYFFHPQEGFAMVFRPIEGMNLFTVTPDPKKGPVPQAMMDQGKDLGDILNELKVDYNTAASWFLDSFVDAVDTYVKTGVVKPFIIAPQPQPQPEGAQATAPQAADAQADGGEEPPFEGASTSEGTAGSFLTQLQSQVDKISQ